VLQVRCRNGRHAEAVGEFAQFRRGIQDRVLGQSLKAWLVVLALWTAGGYAVFVTKSADGGAGLAWGLIAGGVMVALFGLFVFILLRVTGRR
jgi:hypothetical protein